MEEQILQVLMEIKKELQDIRSILETNNDSITTNSIEYHTDLLKAQIENAKTVCSSLR